MFYIRMKLLGVSLSLCASRHWSGKQAGIASAGGLESWVVKRDRWTFCANINMLWALGKSDWQLLNEYWGKHCPFLVFSSFARDGDVGYINRSSGRQVHYSSPFQPSLQQPSGMWQTCCLIYICFCWNAVKWA